MKIISAFSLSLLIMACGNGPSSKIDAKDLSTKAQEANVQILDIRTADEFKANHIEKSINIDIQSPKFDSLISIFYSSLPVYIVANDDQAADKGVTRMNILGFRDAKALKGGVQAWKEAGFELVAEKPKVVYESDTIPFLKARMGSKLVMVDFNATWCKPCKMLEPTVEKIHDERAADVIVYSIDTDENPELAQEYNANQIPLLVFIKNGKEVYRTLGVQPEENLLAIIDKFK